MGEEEPSRETRRRGCTRCGTKLRLHEIEICRTCAEMIMVQTRRRGFLYHFLFQVTMLILVYLFLFEGILPIINLFR